MSLRAAEARTELIGREQKSDLVTHRVRPDESTQRAKCRYALFGEVSVITREQADRAGGWLR